MNYIFLVFSSISIKNTVVDITEIPTFVGMTFVVVLHQSNQKTDTSFPKILRNEIVIGNLLFGLRWFCR